MSMQSSLSKDESELTETGPVSHRNPIKPCCFGNGACSFLFILFRIVTFVEKREQNE